MKFYLLLDPRKYTEYARFAHVGTWTKGGICESCGQGTSRLIKPLQIEWEPDSDIIGDFSWCFYTFIVLDNVKNFLQNNHYECKFEEVEILKPTTKRKGRKIVPYPYAGFNLNWVIPHEKIILNEEKSGVKLEINCEICNQEEYNFKMKDIYIDKSSWKGQKMFRIEQFGKSAATFVTQEGLDLILSQNFTNFGYMESGEIV